MPSRDGDVREPIIVRVEEEIAELIPEFLENRHADTRALAAALASGDFETIRLTGHNLKGNGSAYGFDRLTELGAQFERAALSRDTDTLRSALDDYRDFLVRVEISSA